eukprot:c6066_g1_i1.p1 GENE.c6066_g1_i1~~c6066_g1_i1.p1  ORF type:complete len:313 (-),score=55.23 c6066_g1_i1:24-962(-)
MLNPRPGTYVIVLQRATATSSEIFAESTVTIYPDDKSHTNQFHENQGIVRAVLERLEPNTTHKPHPPPSFNVSCPPTRRSSQKSEAKNIRIRELECVLEQQAHQLRQLEACLGLAPLPEQSSADGLSYITEELKLLCDVEAIYKEHEALRNENVLQRERIQTLDLKIFEQEEEGERLRKQSDALEALMAGICEGLQLPPESRPAAIMQEIDQCLAERAQLDDINDRRQEFDRVKAVIDQTVLKMMDKCLALKQENQHLREKIEKSQSIAQQLQEAYVQRQSKFDQDKAKLEEYRKSQREDSNGLQIFTSLFS